jgi:hypothetical protein
MSIGPSRVNIMVTVLANNQRFATTCRHDRDPFGPFPLSLSLKVFQRSDMVNLHLFL